MAATIVGIDMGTSLLKLAVCSDGAVRRLVAEDMPDNLINNGRISSPEAMAEFIRQTSSKAKLGTRSAAVILPPSVVFTRTLTLPVMSKEHLKLNLPYEFRDFITQEKDKYFYDYAVTDTIMGEDGKPLELELIAAAALRSTIREYSDMLRRAGFKLITAIPEELSYMNILRRLVQENANHAGREFCFIDLGHTATKLHIYKGIKLQATRAMDFGVQMLDAVIAEKFGVDEHIARLHKHANTNNELFDEACTNIYSTISIEIMRAINFYRFNSPNSALSEVFICGGGARIEPLISQLASDINMPVTRVGHLLPDSGNSEDAILCPAAIGATMQ